MKYTYMICLTLSSLFINKPLLADTNTLSHAFFIPTGAFQQNTEVQDIDTMRPRYSVPYEPSTTEETDDTFIEQPTPIAESTPSPTPLQIKKAVQPIQATPKITQQAIAKPLSPAPTSKPTEPAPLPTPSPYKLEDIIPETTSETTQTETDELSPLEAFQQKSLKEMLDTLPYPNFNLPKYKQLYALYVLELRTAYRKGELPYNYEQEQILAKANSIRRFEVK